MTLLTQLERDLRALLRPLQRPRRVDALSVEDMQRLIAFKRRLVRRGFVGGQR